MVGGVRRPDHRRGFVLQRWRRRRRQRVGWRRRHRHDIRCAGGRHHRARGRSDEPVRQDRLLLRAGERGARGGARGHRRRDHRGLHLDHAHPRDARGPRGSRVRDPDRRPRRPGREVRRHHQRPLWRHQRPEARPQPRGGATDRARGPGPELGRPGGLHRGHGGQRRRVRVLRQRLGRPGRRGVCDRCTRHRLPDDLQRHAGRPRRGRQPALLDDGVVGRRPRVPRPHARRAGCARRQDDRHRDAGLARGSRHRRTGSGRHARGARTRAGPRRRARLRRRQRRAARA